VRRLTWEKRTDLQSFRSVTSAWLSIGPSAESKAESKNSSIARGKPTPLRWSAVRTCDRRQALRIPTLWKSVWKRRTEYSTALSSAGQDGRESREEMSQSRKEKGCLLLRCLHEPSHQTRKVLLADDQIETSGEGAVATMREKEIAIQLQTLLTAENRLFVALESLESEALAVVCLNMIRVQSEAFVKLCNRLHIALEIAIGTASCIGCLVEPERDICQTRPEPHHISLDHEECVFRMKMVW
jgi:hypothetical protein